MAFLKLTEAEIEAGKSEAGGYTWDQFRTWGVPCPPPKGWKYALLSGTDPADPANRVAPEETPQRLEIPDAHPAWPYCSAHDLLRNVVLAVIEAGHASDLYEFPEVLAYFDAQLPSDPQAYYRERGSLDV